MSEAYKQLERMANDLGLTVLFDYQPHKYPPDTDPNKMQLRWKCRIFRHHKEILSTDYFQGSAFCDASPKGFRMTVAQAEAIRKECEKGPNRMEPKQPFDVLWNLCVDIIGVDDHPDFESWATEFGYDADSRKAHRIWERILSQGHALRCSIGADAIQKIANVEL